MEKNNYYAGFKKGPAADPSNYRPIAQTSVFCKLMERVISRDMFLYLKAHGLLNANQYGFTARRSTLTNLLDSLYDWTSSLENKFPTDVIYIDFHKAFDTVSHPKLFYKLESSGIVGSLLSLIRDLLSNRLQCTKVGNSYSDYTDVTCGVVQGSVLGPLLFLIYINDIFDILPNTVTSKLYADDLKIYTVLTDPCSRNALHDSIERIQNWASEWQLTISINKCQHLHIGRLSETYHQDFVPYKFCHNKPQCSF